MDVLKNNMIINTDLQLVVIDSEITVGEASDIDLMKIKCFACHEGVNLNNVEFPRNALVSGYKSFVDKPVFIVIGKDGLPQGHGYDYKTKKFSSKDRKQVGHIVNAYPCIVDSDGKITDVSWMDEQNYPDGELRIICDLVIYKNYESKISELLANLHIANNLKFSMESVCDTVTGEDGISHCTSIHFIGLAIVKTPAFENSFSLNIAEKEEILMEFEKLYNDEHTRAELLASEKATLVTDNATLVSEKAELENSLTATKEQLAEVNGKLIEANTQIETLVPFKEKVETAEKLEVGQKRLDKLTKYGKVEKTKEELAELSNSDFVDVLAEFVDNYKPTNANTFLGLPNGNTTIVSNKEKLLSTLDDLLKEVK